MLLDHEGQLRLLRRIADSVAKALKKGAGGKPDEAMSELQELCSSALGMEFSVLSMLDPHSAVDLLGAHHRVLAFVHIVEAMGDVERDQARALRRHQQAFHLAAVLQERDGSKPLVVETVARLLARIS